MTTMIKMTSMADFVELTSDENAAINGGFADFYDTDGGIFRNPNGNRLSWDNTNFGLCAAWVAGGIAVGAANVVYATRKKPPNPVTAGAAFVGMVATNAAFLIRCRC